MIRQSLMILVASLWTAPSAMAQVEVGNGGDLVECRSESGSDFQGFYFLDYLVMYASTNVYHPGDAPLTRIVNLVEERDLALGANLREFVAQANRQIGSLPDRTQRFQWQRADNGVATLGDENLAFLPERFPTNCMEPGAGRRLKLHQVVFHSPRSDAVHTYKFDGAHLARIEGNALQYSHMIVHEWLWQFASQAHLVREANRFFQTSEMLQTDSSNFRSALRNMGLDLGRVPPTGPQSPTDGTLYKSDLGRLRIRASGLWKAVCAQGFDEVAGRVACMQLDSAYAGHGAEGDDMLQSGMSSWRCTGGENSLVECPAAEACDGGAIVLTCDDRSSGRVRRQARGDIRLAGPNTILEVMDRGQWSGVCDDGFDANAATVACRQLGGTVSSFATGQRGRGGDYAVDDLVCTGNETSLVQCPRRSGADDCGEEEHVALVCKIPGTTSLTSGDVRLTGNVAEVYHFNEWRALCDDTMDQSPGIPLAVCQALGGGTPDWHSVDRPDERFWAVETGECAPGARGLRDCGWNPHVSRPSCRQSEHVSLDCR